MNKHRTKNIRIKGRQRADVDIGAIRMVKWLNSMPGVTTRYSCQGDGEESPMVMFTCSNHRSFKGILRAMEGLAIVEVDLEPNPNVDKVRYTAWLFGKKALRKLYKII